MGGNQAVYDQGADAYPELSLQPAERELLRRLKSRWHEIDMLDLGVGSGRTAYTFAAITRSYLGLDYSPQMVRLCKSLIAEDDAVQVDVGDARRLEVGDRRFDLVLFSYNGIDSVGHEDRLRVLEEVGRVLRPGGHFLFSSHSLRWLPFRPRVSPVRRHDVARSTYRAVKSVPHSLRLMRLNRELSLDEARSRGWAIVRDPAHGFELRLYYVDPEHQVEQLTTAGFAVEAVLDSRGRVVDAALASSEEPWYHYLCSPASNSQPSS